MVAITANRPYEDITKALKPNEKVAVLTCNTCTRIYQTGGPDLMNELADRLEADGFEVSDRVVLTAACFEDYIQVAPMTDEFTSAIVLACDSGCGVAKRYLKGKQIIPGVKTMGIAQGRKPKPVLLLEE